MNCDALLNLAMEIGCQLMRSGAEIYRVEESVYRLLQAYGGEDAQVFAIPSCLIVSLRASDGHPVTRMRRIPPHGTDIELLERCNELCRTLCRTVPPLEQAQEQAQRLSERRVYRPAQVLLGYALAPAFFTPLFGGGARDALCALLCGSRWLGNNSLLRTVVCSAVAALGSVVLVRMGVGVSVDLITIGVLMLLVPGVALTNAMWEIMAGDVYSGMSRTTEAILTAAGIALGAALGLWAGQTF